MSSLTNHNPPPNSAMNQIAIQYLEDCPELAGRSIKKIRERLRIAGEKLPLSKVLIGWRLPPTILELCRQETERMGASLYRWHPLLTGDGVFYPRPEWQVIGLNGQPVAGFRNLPEFTFVCPNRPAVEAAVMEHLEKIIRRGDYQGIFLDRIRFPSPAGDPIEALGCFCESCQAAAARQGLDLARIRATLQQGLKTVSGRRELVRFLLQPLEKGPDSPPAESLQAFLQFRCQSITNFVSKAASRFFAAAMPVGLDCFSPMLMSMVGQDQRRLGRCVDWIKLMSYAHTLGPAGIPFELLALAGWLVNYANLNEQEALKLLSLASALPLPENRETMRREGLSSPALQLEIERGLAATATPSLFGVELVEIEGVTRLNPTQIKEDLTAIRAVNPAGLALSWDLWDMPLDRLDLVREVWL